VVRDLTAEEMARKATGTQTYQELARRSLATMQLTEALTVVAADRRRFGKT